MLALGVACLTRRGWTPAREEEERDCERKDDATVRTQIDHLVVERGLTGGLTKRGRRTDGKNPSRGRDNPYVEKWR